MSHFSTEVTISPFLRRKSIILRKTMKKIPLHTEKQDGSGTAPTWLSFTPSESRPTLHAFMCPSITPLMGSSRSSPESTSLSPVVYYGRRPKRALVQELVPVSLQASQSSLALPARSLFCEPNSLSVSLSAANCASLVANPFVKVVIFGSVLLKRSLLDK